MAALNGAPQPQPTTGTFGAAHNAVPVNLQTVDEDGSVTHFKMKPTTVLKKLMDAYIMRKMPIGTQQQSQSGGVSTGTPALVFSYHGTVLTGHETAASLGMVDGAAIQIWREGSSGTGSSGHVMKGAHEIGDCAVISFAKRLLSLQQDLPPDYSPIATTEEADGQNALSVWNYTFLRSRPAVKNPLAPNAKDRDETLPLLFPLEGILFSLLLSHCEEEPDRETGGSNRCDVALAVHFARCLAQGAAFRELAPVVRQRTTETGHRTWVYTPKPEFSSGRATQHFPDCLLHLRDVTPTYTELELSAVMPLSALGILPPHSMLLGSGPSCAHAMAGCMWGEQIDLFRIIMAKTTTSHASSSLFDHLEGGDIMTLLDRSPVFAPPNISLPKPCYEPPLDGGRWAKLGVNFAQLFKRAFAISSRNPMLSNLMPPLGYDPTVLQAVCDLDDSDIKQLDTTGGWSYSTSAMAPTGVGSLLIRGSGGSGLRTSIFCAALNSVPTLNACLKRCGSAVLETIDPVALFQLALNPRRNCGDPRATQPHPTEVLGMLWEQFGERLKSVWTVASRRLLLQAACLSGHLPNVAFALDVLQIPLQEPCEDSDLLMAPGTATGGYGMPCSLRNLFLSQSFLLCSVGGNDQIFSFWHAVAWECWDFLHRRGVKFDTSTALFLACLTHPQERDGWRPEGGATVSSFVRFLVECVAAEDAIYDIDKQFTMSGKVPPQSTSIFCAAVRLDVPLVKYLHAHGATLDRPLLYKAMSTLSLQTSNEQYLLDLLEYVIVEVGVDPAPVMIGDRCTESLTSCLSLMTNCGAVGWLHPYLNLGEIGSDGHIALTRWLPNQNWCMTNCAPLYYPESWNRNWKHPSGNGMDLLHLAILHENYGLFCVVCRHLGPDFVKAQNPVLLPCGSFEKKAARGPPAFGFCSSTTAPPRPPLGSTRPQPTQAQKQTQPSLSLLQAVLSACTLASSPEGHASTGKGEDPHRSTGIDHPVVDTSPKHKEDDDTAPSPSSTSPSLLNVCAAGPSPHRSYTPIALARAINQEHTARFMERLL